jgi:hypothetical protein
MKKILRTITDFLFNPNTGLFYCIDIHTDGGEPRTVFVIRKGVRYLWIHTSRLIDVVFSMDDLKSRMDSLGVDIPWKQN